MSLSAKDKATVTALWSKISKSSDEIGAQAFGRLLKVYPQSKTYFSHWKCLDTGSEPVKNHGKTIMIGIALAMKNIDDLKSGLLDLSEKHAFKMKVDPANFKLLAHCIEVVIANMFPNEFTPEVHVCFDKFMEAVSLALSERYR